ncbi:alpha/beta hydrolase [Parahaliea maris]|uniref:Alpha/beta hydrolase n=1 Tax=Parahaliea maris TaxID=2716870 RepID=A0A5C8ZWX4_9GAMM|nr:alpha/beta hydrolase [Parahaliea maris]TXS91977.1 alpha/beta hydrolase [Parahaliea maris]
MKQLQLGSAFSLAGLLTLSALSLPAAATDFTPSCGAPSAGTITREEIVAKYADENSKFIRLEGNDGINLHYKDQGSGPAVLLIHSSGGDLKDWDGWVKELATSYRVIRFDLPAFGLTGPVPSRNYSIDRYLTLVDSLMDNLGIEHFTIAGTSYGGLVAFRYAGTRTDRVDALILQNSAGIEYGGHKGTKERKRDPNKPFVPVAWTTEKMEATMKDGINDHSRVTPEMVQRKTDYWNVIGRDCEAFVATNMYERGNPQRVLSHVKAPSLVLWGEHGKGLSPETGKLFADALTNAESVKLVMYEGGGHLMHLGRPEATVKDVKAFLDSTITK